jgi:Leucine-rich repeat (LRR) protein
LEELIVNKTLIVNLSRHISGLKNLPNLKRLYLVSNKIAKIENLEALRGLEMLELGDNKIRRIENLDQLTALNQLFLGKNKIRDDSQAGNMCSHLPPPLLTVLVTWRVLSSPPLR